MHAFEPRVYRQDYVSLLAEILRVSLVDVTNASQLFYLALEPTIFILLSLAYICTYLLTYLFTRLLTYLLTGTVAKLRFQILDHADDGFVSQSIDRL